MISTQLALPIRPGEHACCRSSDPRDAERLLVAFVRAGLAQGHKVVHLCEGAEQGDQVARLSADAAVDAALARGQVEVRDAAGAYASGGGFDAADLVQVVRAEHHRALGEGYRGVSISGDVGAGMRGAAGERVVEGELRLDAEPADATRTVLCRYDQPALDDRTLTEATAAHHVVVSPALAALGRTGLLAAARVTPPETLRLVGELDFEAADAVAGVLATEFRGPRRVDAADLAFVDVAGMRALRGPPVAPLVVLAASDAVRRLVGLLGWDTDPSVQVPA